jgi:hypothetical protein
MEHAPVAGPSRYFTPSYPQPALLGGDGTSTTTTANGSSLRSPPGMMAASTSDLRLQDETVYAFDYVEQPVGSPMAAAGNGRPGSPSLPPPQDHRIGTNGHAARSAFQVGGGGEPLPDLVYSGGGGGGGGGSNGFDRQQQQQQHDPFATTTSAAATNNVYDFGPPSDSTTSAWLNPADFVASSSSASNGNRKGKGPMPPPGPVELQREGAAAGTRGARKRQRTTRAAQQHQDHVLDYGGGGGVEVGRGLEEEDDDDPEADNGSEYLGEDGDGVAYNYSGRQRRARYGGEEDARLGAGDDPGDDDFSAASGGGGGGGGGGAAILEDAAAQDETEPLYVNAKQYHRILKRRIARARLEEMGRLSRERKVRFLFWVTTRLPPSC